MSTPTQAPTRAPLPDLIGRLTLDEAREVLALMKQTDRNEYGTWVTYGGWAQAVEALPAYMAATEDDRAAAHVLIGDGHAPLTALQMAKAL